MIVNEISLVIQNWISIINISYKPTINNMSGNEENSWMRNNLQWKAHTENQDSNSQEQTDFLFPIQSSSFKDLEL